MIKVSGFIHEISDNIDELLAKYKELGIKYIGINNVSKYTINEIKEFKNIIDRYGIRVSTIGSSIGSVLITDNFKEQISLFENVIEIAKILGTKYVRMFSFYIPEGEDPLKYRDEVLRRLAILIAYAEKNDIVLLHENGKGFYGDTEVRCLELFNKFSSKSFQMAFNFTNILMCNLNTKQVYCKLKNRIKFIQIQNTRKEDGKEVISEFDGNQRFILNDITNCKYDGFISFYPQLNHFQVLETLKEA